MLSATQRTKTGAAAHSKGMPGMDAKNPFHTRATYALMRVDYLTIMVVLSAVVLYNANQVRWGRFALAFVMIDVIGYIPGLVWYLRSRTNPRRIPSVFHVLYNTAHSFGVNALVALVWGWLLGGRLEWAMLALPIHLCGDRGVFGNVYKPFGLSFEPVKHPAFQRFVTEFEVAGKW